VRNILLDYVEFLTLERKQEIEYYSKNTKIKILDSEKLFKNHDAKFTLKCNNNILKNKIVGVAIDDMPPFMMAADSNGEITLKNLSCEAHEICVTFDGTMSSNFYVNSKIGILPREVVLKDSSANNVEGVTNILNKLSSQPPDTLAEYLLFARHSYDLLTPKEKSKIVNYNKLLLCENGITNPAASRTAQKYDFVLANKVWIFTSFGVVACVVWFFIIKLKLRATHIKKLRVLHIYLADFE
jgi:hypothetical protein